MKGLILAFALFFSSAGAPPPSNQKLIGSWRLVRFTRTIVATGQTFETFGKKPSGFIQFGNDGRMSAEPPRSDVKMIHFPSVEKEAL